MPKLAFLRNYMDPAAADKMLKSVYLIAEWHRIYLEMLRRFRPSFPCYLKQSRLLFQKIRVWLLLHF